MTMSKREAKEILAVGLAGGGPTAEMASLAFEQEFEEALAVLYPIPDEDGDEEEETVS